MSKSHDIMALDCELLSERKKRFLLGICLLVMLKGSV